MNKRVWVVLLIVCVMLLAQGGVVQGAQVTEAQPYCLQLWRGTEKVTELRNSSEPPTTKDVFLDPQAPVQMDSPNGLHQIWIWPQKNQTANLYFQRNGQPAELIDTNMPPPLRSSIQQWAADSSYFVYGYYSAPMQVTAGNKPYTLGVVKADGTAKISKVLQVDEISPLLGQEGFIYLHRDGQRRSLYLVDIPSFATVQLPIDAANNKSAIVENYGIQQWQWSPNRDKLAVLYAKGRSMDAARAAYEVAVIWPQQNRFVLAAVPRLAVANGNPNFQIKNLFWSPDGRYLLFNSFDGSALYDTAPLKGSTGDLVGPIKVSPFYTQWLGSSLVFAETYFSARVNKPRVDLKKVDIATWTYETLYEDAANVDLHSRVWAIAIGDTESKIYYADKAANALPLSITLRPIKDFYQADLKNPTYLVVQQDDNQWAMIWINQSDGTLHTLPLDDVLSEPIVYNKRFFLLLTRSNSQYHADLFDFQSGTLKRLFTNSSPLTPANFIPATLPKRGVYRRLDDQVLPPASYEKVLLTYIAPDGMMRLEYFPLNGGLPQSFKLKAKDAQLAVLMSPDQRNVLVAYNSGRFVTFELASIQGESIKIDTNDRSLDFPPLWSPDSRQVVIYQTVTGNTTDDSKVKQTIYVGVANPQGDGFVLQNYDIPDPFTRVAWSSCSRPIWIRINR